MTISQRLTALREHMADAHIDVYYIPSDDFHGSEYVGAYFRCREWISGFTGSAGVVVVTADSAGLWTDGRYFLQAAEQLEGTGIQLYRMGEPDVPTLTQYLTSILQDGQCLGFDGRTVTAYWLDALKEQLSGRDVSFRTDVDLIGDIWEDRPPRSHQPAWLLDESFTGQSRTEKIRWLRKSLQESGADWLILSSLDDIEWLLNLRGNDIPYNPVQLSYIMLSQRELRIFVQLTTMDLVVSNALVRDRIHCFPYDDITLYLSRLHDVTVQLDRRHTSCALVEALNDTVTICDKPSPTTLAKATKNPTEVRNMQEAHRKDGVAMVRFLHWLKETIGTEPISEISAAEKLEQFREQDTHYLQPSFAPISAYGAHGAIVHYSATARSNAPLKPQGFLLLDTGGQYLEGTTDITRTIALGPLTYSMKQHYTAVLRGNLNLAAAVFRAGITGINLDILARAPLWELGLDFNHGTGHGVGYLLCCHEGPQAIRFRPSADPANNAVFDEGMITSDEPGLYLPGEYGIRLENLLLCRSKESTAFGDFLCFDPLTLAPFDREAILPDEMTARERELLDAYHERVYTELSPRLDELDREWLRQATLPIESHIL